MNVWLARIAAVVAVAVASAVVVALVWPEGDEGTSVQSNGDGVEAVDPGVVDYHGVRFDVPDGFFVQDVDGLVDGELACPDAPGFVMTGLTFGIYADATCPFDDDDVVIYLVPVDAGLTEYFEHPEATGHETGSVNGIEYARSTVAERTSAYLREPSMSVGVTGPDASRHLDALLASLRPSPDDAELATPTTAEVVTEVTDRLADELDCESVARASTYSRGDNAPFLGRQAEPPVDCEVESFGFRAIVLSDPADRDLVVDYYTGAYLVADDEWLLTAMSERAAEFAQARVGGQIIPPPEPCCFPPTSDHLPG